MGSFRDRIRTQFDHVYLRKDYTKRGTQFFRTKHIQEKSRFFTKNYTTPQNFMDVSRPPWFRPWVILTFYP